MELIPNDAFFRSTEKLGIGFDPRYPDARHLTLLPPTESNRFWTLPGDPRAWPPFVLTLLGSLDDWAEGLLWARDGSWPPHLTASPIIEGVRGVVLRGVGIPDAWTGAVRFKRGEENELVAVIYVFLAFGWCVKDDLFFVPDHGRQILRTDHHDVIHVECRTEERVNQLVAHMAGEGYELPTEPPDWTFKWPAWMGPEPTE
jgi:hypothetical protein